MTDEHITPGYRYGDTGLETSPVSLHELDLLKATLLWSSEDDDALHLAAEVLADQADDVLDVWYGYVGDNPHLLAHFSTADGEPIDDYLSAVRERFKRWIFDTCTRPYDQAWLDWQHEIALRHHRARKNRTDGVESTDQIPMRYIAAFIFPLTATMRPFLASKGHGPADVDAMHAAWFKAVTLQATLWCRPHAGADW